MPKISWRKVAGMTCFGILGSGFFYIVMMAEGFWGALAIFGFLIAVVGLAIAGFALIE
jgi:hypothetical protein